MSQMPPRLAKTSSKEHLTRLERADKLNHEKRLRKAEGKIRNMRVRDDWLRKEHGGEKASQEIWTQIFFWRKRFESLSY